VDPRDPVTISEWTPSHFIADVTLDASDLALAEKLRDGDRLTVEQVGAGIRISATSWIGVVRLSEVEVRIVPKYAGGDLGVLQMLDYARGLPALVTYDALRTLKAEGRSLVDLLGWLLAERTERIVRGGLIADYVPRTDRLRVLRGRLQVMDQVRQHFGQVDVLECAFEEHESDVVENQVVGAAMAVARRVCSDPEVLSKIGRLLPVLDEACDASSLDAASARAVLDYNRRNEHYRPAHEIAWLFLARLGVDDLFASGRTQAFAFLLDMNQLFEDFVTRLLGDALEPGIRVHAQRRDRSIVENELTGRPYAAIIPDILLDRGSGRNRIRLPVDAKYKLYDVRRLDPSDVYQAFFYAYAYHAPMPGQLAEPTALLVYPSAEAGVRVALRVARADSTTTARIQAVGIHIPTTLKAIEERSISSLPEVMDIRSILRQGTVAAIA
jgi:5-methylcytosine-specific restriction enzyme subunit McrC